MMNAQAIVEDAASGDKMDTDNLLALRRNYPQTMQNFPVKREVERSIAKSAEGLEELLYLHHGLLGAQSVPIRTEVENVLKHETNIEHAGLDDIQNAIDEIAQNAAVVRSATAGHKETNKYECEEKRRKCKEGIQQLERKIKEGIQQLERNIEEITLEEKRRDEEYDHNEEVAIAELETSKEYLIKGAESLKEAAAARLALPWALKEVDRRAFDLLFRVIEYNHPRITSSESEAQEIQEKKKEFFDFLELIERKDEDMNMRTLMDLFLAHNNF
jgi:hypothetical protein